MRFDGLSVTTATAPTGSPELRFAIAAPDDGEFSGGAPEATTRLERREVEALHEFLGEWLR